MGGKLTIIRKTSFGLIFRISKHVGISNEKTEPLNDYFGVRLYATYGPFFSGTDRIIQLKVIPNIEVGTWSLGFTNSSSL